MANFLLMSSLDKVFTIGKVAFGETDYLELSAYFSVIFGLSLVIYYQLFHSQDAIKEEKPTSSPVKMAVVIEGK